jgi:hypothetical protein
MILCLVVPPAAARPKKDVVVVKNGDRLKGEIKSLKYGQLKLGTDSMGSIYIEWPDVLAVHSPQLFTIESSRGKVLVGTLAPGSDSTRVRIQPSSGSATEFRMADISLIDQLQLGFWNRIDGSVSFGFDYEKATDIVLMRSRFDSQYRSPTKLAGLNATADISHAAEGQTKESFSIGSNLRLLRGKSRFWAGFLSWQRNEELGIASRLQLAVGPGGYLYRNAESELSLFAGINGNQEWTFGSSDQTASVEAVVGTEWRMFRFREPETSFYTSLIVLPSLTESGRTRLDYNLTFSQEVISDLTIDLTYYADVDTKPPGDGEKTDTGVSLSVGYKF